ncbi:hypothetical protein CsSME_00051735 [Camellia sinensis var. sinensis]
MNSALSSSVLEESFEKLHQTEVVNANTVPNENIICWLHHKKDREMSFVIIYKWLDTCGTWGT